MFKSVIKLNQKWWDLPSATHSKRCIFLGIQQGRGEIVFQENIHPCKTFRFSARSFKFTMKISFKPGIQLQDFEGSLNCVPSVHIWIIHSNSSWLFTFEPAIQKINRQVVQRRSSDSLNSVPGPTSLIRSLDLLHCKL